MVNDGGLDAMIQLSDQIWNELCLLNEKKMTSVGEAATSSATAARSRMTMKQTKLSRSDSGNKILDLSQHSECELKRAVSPLIKEMEKLDAAALLSLNPMKEGGNESSKESGAALDPKRGLKVTPIHDRILPPCDNCYDDDYMGGSNRDKLSSSVVRYLHVVDAPQKFSVGIFVFPPNARMPLHDHPNMIVLSRVLYGELQVQSYDIVGPTSHRDGANDSRNDVDALVSAMNNTDSSIIDHCNEDGKESTTPKIATGVLRKSLSKIKDFLSMKMVSYSSHGTDDDDDNIMQTDPVLYVLPNLNPLGTVRRRSSSTAPISTNESVDASPVKIRVGGDGTSPAAADNVDDDQAVIISAPSVTCLFPREGNCHAFVAGPQGAALLDVLLPPYDTEEVRDCTFYEVANEQHYPILSAAATTTSLKLTPIAQPDDFHCVSGSYGRFGACQKLVNCDKKPPSLNNE